MQLRYNRRRASRSRARWVLAAGALAAISGIRNSYAGVFRIVSYNVDCADQGSDNNITQSTGAATDHSLPTVMQGIGQHHIGVNAQPFDVMGLEELTSTTLSNFVTQLNTIYGSGTYAFDPTTDPNTGGGPDGLIYNTHTVQVVSARALPSGTANVLLQPDGHTYSAAHFITQSETVPRAPMVYQLRPIGTNGSADVYMYVSHARSTSDDAAGDARYAEAQEVRSDAKYKLPSNAHVIYTGDWNLFDGSGENAYKCLTGQSTSDAINWADNSVTWANTNPTQAYDPTSKTNPLTTTTWANVSGDNATYLYGDSTTSLTSRIDVQLGNALMYGAYNNQPGMQLAPDTYDPFDPNKHFPSSQYPYAFEVFGNNGSTARSGAATSAANNSLSDLTGMPNASTVLGDIKLVGSGTATFTGSDHYPVVGDYTMVGFGQYWTGVANATWEQGGNWSGLYKPVSSDDIAFNSPVPASGSTITLGNGEIARSLTFNDNYTFTGGSLSLSEGTVTVASGKTASIGSALSTTGTLTKSGSGTLVLSASTTASSAVVGAGTLSINAGNFAVTGNETIALTGNASVTQAGGTHTVTGTLVLGSSASSNGSYTLSAGLLQAADMTVGAAGTGSFQQTGGTFIKTGAMTLGRDAGSSGTYALCGGTLNDPAIVVGKNGSGAFVQNTASGPSTLTTTSLTIAGGSGSGSYNYQSGTLNAGAIQVNSGGVFTHAAAGALSVNTLSLTGTGQYLMTPGNNKALVLSSLSIADSSALDLNDNALVVNYSASDTTHSVRDQIRNLLVNGRNGAAGQPGAWNGAGGIISSFANTNGNGFNLAIGYGDNEDIALVRGSGSYTAFGGQTVASNTVLIQMTRGADATLDGVVDAQDVTILGAHFNKPGSGQWVFGDFDYSGTCDATDVTTLGSTFGKTTPVLSPAQLTAEYGSAFASAFEAGASGAVPEPGSLGIVLGAGLFMHRRMRCSKSNRR